MNIDWKRMCQFYRRQDVSALQNEKTVKDRNILFTCFRISATIKNNFQYL